MKNLSALTISAILFTLGCGDVVKKENRELVRVINYKTSHIDANHRVLIREDDFHEGDSIYKVRAYYHDDEIVKLVSVLRTPHIERDDYFYFEENAPIFSGHLMNNRDDHAAAEFKYYYGEDGIIAETLFWEDTYTPGKRFPHENFKEFDPDIDSLMMMEVKRLAFYMRKLDSEGFEVLRLNENLEANTLE